jgi:hypothetical protein
VVPEPGVFYSFFFIPVLLTTSSLFFYPYSHTHHSPSSCITIYCSPSQLLFLPLLICSFLWLHLPLLTSPNPSPHYPSLLHTHNLLTSLLNQLHKTQPPAIPNKKCPLLQQQCTQTYTRATTQHPPCLLPYPTTFSYPPFFSTTFTNSPKSITSLITITSPQILAVYNITIKRFSI